MLLFESGSGSSWLTQLLAAHPHLCVVLFEPIDNATLTSSADHEARLRWLDLLWSPPPSAAPASEWAAWRQRMVAASAFGQLPLIQQSLERCTPDSRAFGLKARLSRLLNHEAAVQGLRALLARRRVRVLRLERRNRIKQALTEYRRLYAGLGHFKAAREGGKQHAGQRAVVDLRLFRKSVKAVERSHKLATKVLTQLQPSQPQLTLSYEAMLDEHAATMQRVAGFLGVEPPAAAPAAASTAGGGGGGDGAYRKATPDRLCAAVENYAELCGEWSHGAYAEHFEDPCDDRMCGAAR